MSSLKDLSNKISKLHGISSKSSLRLAEFLLKNKEESIDNFNQIINSLKDLFVDEKTGIILSKGEVANNNLDKSKLMVFENNIEANNIIEKINTNDSYFILNINNKRNLESIKIEIDRLIFLIKEYNSNEVIFLLSPSIENELIIRITSEELKKDYPKKEIPKLTKISMGIPFGGSLEFSDQRTLRKAIINREKI